MALSLREAIRIGRISFSKFFFSISMETAATAKQRILDELLNFSVITEAPKNAFGKVFPAMKQPLCVATSWLSLRVLSQVRKTYTGKLAGLQDDVVIALQLALIASKVFFESPRYQGTNSSLKPFLSLQTPAFPAHPCTFFPSLCVLSRLARFAHFCRECASSPSRFQHATGATRRGMLADDETS